MSRQKWSWTDKQRRRAENVLEVTEDLQPYWPLTLRQIYYRLVATGVIDNTPSQYNMLSRLLKWMRIDDWLPWETLVDRTRRVSRKRGVGDVEEFYENEVYWLFGGYERCLIQGQERYIEVWVEKDALSIICEEITNRYCVRTVVCRGYNSVTFLADFYRRASTALENGQTPTVLYFGDLDPSGVQALEASITTLEDELMLGGVEFERIALNPDQVRAYNLPYDPKAVKVADPRYGHYVRRYGDYAVELDALHPRDLQNLIEQGIRDRVDTALIDEHLEIERNEQEKLEKLRSEAKEFIKNRAKKHGIIRP